MDETTQQQREMLGQKVRKVWVDYCLRIGDTKPSHIAPWEALSEQDKEADRVIGEALWSVGFTAGVTAMLPSGRKNFKEKSLKKKHKE